MKPEIQISVIIVNWNGKHHLDECLRSLEEQTFKDFETILIDNGSTDGSVTWVRKYFPWVKIVELEENKGFCCANNLGFAMSNGSFVALLNNDTKVIPNWLYFLYQEINKDEQIGICASRIVQYDKPNIIDSAGDCYDFSGVGFKRGYGENIDFFNRPEEVFGACACAVLFRKSMLDDIGFFDESFFAVGEDIDLSFRAKIAGYKCIYVPQSIVLHKISRTIGMGSDFQLYQSRKNVEYVYFKNMPLLLICLTLPVHFLYNLMTFLQAVKEDRQKIYLKAKKDFLLNLKKVLKKRKNVQSQRKILLSCLFTSFSFNYLIKRSKKLEMVSNKSAVDKHRKNYFINFIS